MIWVIAEINEEYIKYFISHNWALKVSGLVFSIAKIRRRKKLVVDVSKKVFVVYISLLCYILLIYFFNHSKKVGSEPSTKMKGWKLTKHPFFTFKTIKTFFSFSTYWWVTPKLFKKGSGPLTAKTWAQLKGWTKKIIETQGSLSIKKRVRGK